MVTNVSIFSLQAFRLFFISGLVFTASIGCSSVNKIKTLSENKKYPEKELKRKLKAGENHLYSIQLNAGDLFHMQAEQYGIDLIAKVSAVDGQYIEQFDLPTGELDAEDIYLFSEVNRKYTIEIYPAQKYADPGDYVLRIVRSGYASEEDKKWMTALAATQKADKMRTKAETREKSIQQYESALAEWRALKDPLQYARAMRSLGFVYIRLRNYDKAVAVFTQLLQLWKELGDIRSEGFTLLIIGRIYDLQKEYTKSLAYNLKSLPYWTEAKDNDQESFTLMNIGDLYAYLADNQKTMDYFAQALKKNEQSERPSVKAVILRDYANSLLKLGNEEKAIQLYEQSLKQWQTTVNTAEEARTAVLLVAHFSKKGNQKEAVYYYRHALAIWEKMNNQDEIKNIQAALDKLEK